MSDWQQPGPTPTPPAPQAPPTPGYAPPPPGYGPPPAAAYGAATPQPPVVQPPAPKKKRTGLIIAIVLIVLLLCCCASAAVGLIAYRGVQDGTTSWSSSVSTSTDEDTPEPEDDPTAEGRAAEWAKVTAAYVKSDDAEYTAPDDRQLELAKTIIAELLPDFTLDELMIDPGYIDDDGSYIFDGYTVKLHLNEDPRVVTAYGFDVGTVEADEAKLKAENVDVDEGDEKMQVGNGTWVLYPAKTKVPLLRGITDHSYVDLLLLAKQQWPDGLPTEILPQEDGSVLLKIETWDSYNYSDTYDRIEATYIRGTGWELRDFKSVVEPKDEPGTDQGVVI